MKENFLAPEQYQYNSTVLSNLENISEDDLPPFNEKIDIYKIPAITGTFLDFENVFCSTDFVLQKCKSSQKPLVVECFFSGRSKNL